MRDVLIWELAYSPGVGAERPFYLSRNRPRAAAAPPFVLRNPAPKVLADNAVAIRARSCDGHVACVWDACQWLLSSLHSLLMTQHSRCPRHRPGCTRGFPRAARLSHLRRLTEWGAQVLDESLWPASLAAIVRALLPPASQAQPSQRVRLWRVAAVQL